MTMLDKNEGLRKAADTAQRIEGTGDYNPMDYFLEEERTCQYHMGCPDFRDFGTLYLIVRAGSALCGMRTEAARKLLEAALESMRGRE